LINKDYGYDFSQVDLKQLENVSMIIARSLDTAIKIEQLQAFKSLLSKLNGFGN
jgi:hypothetical protein